MSISGAAVTFNSSASPDTAYSLSINSTASLTIINDAALTISGAVQNSGALDVNDGGSGGSSLTVDGTLTNSNGVQIGNGDLATTVTTQGLNNTGEIYLYADSTLTTSGNITNSGDLYVNYSGSGASSLTIGGTLTNSGYVLIDNDGQTTTVTAQGLSNTAAGEINIDGGSTNQALLNITGAGGAPATWTGILNISGDGVLEFSSGSIGTIASGAEIILSGSEAWVADEGALTGNTALSGLSNIAGELALQDGASLTTSGNLTNSGALDVNDGGSGGSSLTVDGTLTNSNGVQIGNGDLATTVTTQGLNNTGEIYLYADSTLTTSGNITNSGDLYVNYSGSGASSLTIGGTLTNSGYVLIDNDGQTTTVTAQGLSNTAAGEINIDGGSTNQALLNITGAAGAPATWTGILNISGDGVLEFSSGSIGTIASGAEIILSGSEAWVADEGALTGNTALSGLSNIAGELALQDGASLTTSGNLTNSGALDVNDGGSGGSSLTVDGTLTNSNGVQIGNGDLATTVTTQGLNNTGEIYLYADSTLTTSGNITNSGDLYVNYSGSGASSLTIGGTLTNSGYVLIDNDGQTTTVTAQGLSNAAAGEVNIDGGSTLNVSGSMTDEGTISGAGTLILTGTFLKSASDTTTISTAFDNDGTVNVESGTLNLTGGGTDTGSFYEGSGVLEFGGTRTINDVTLSGYSGTLTIDNSGTLNFVTAASAINFSNLTNEGGSDSEQIDDVRVTFDDTTVSGGAITETGAGAQINVDAGNTLTLTNTTLTLSNTTLGNGALLVAGTLDVASSVTLAGSGVVTIASGGTADFQDTMNLAAAFLGVGMLQLAHSASDTSGTISGFGLGDALDLQDLSYEPGEYTAWSQSTGTLLIYYSGSSTPAETLNIAGTYTTGNFSLTSDVSGGTSGGTEVQYVPSSGPTVDSWTGAGLAGDWYDPNNWTNGVPTSNSEVEIDPASAAAITISGATVYSIDTNSNVTLDIEGGTLAVTSSADILGPVEVAGGATFNTPTGTMDLVSNAGLVQNSDDGTLYLTGNVDNSGGTIAAYEDTSGSTIQLGDITISDGTLIIGDLTNNDTSDILLVDNGDAATLDDVTVDNSGAIDVGLTMPSSLILENGTSVTGGTLYINSGSSATFDDATVSAATITVGYQQPFSTVSDPFGNSSYALGINDGGQIVGYYDDDTESVHGFLLSDGQYTTLADPSANTSDNQGTYASGIANDGTIVGYYFGADDAFHGFIATPASDYSTFTELDDPSADSDFFGGTYATAINAGANGAASEVAGYYYDSLGTSHGFVYSVNNSSFTNFTDPNMGSTGGTYATGINDSGEVVGYYFDSDGEAHGFTAIPNNDGVYTSASFTDLNDPFGVYGTYAIGINDADEVVGYYFGANHDVQGFVYESGIYVGLSDPQGDDTYATAINNSGQIVGYYETDSLNGFAVASPATLTLTDGAMLSGDTLAINPGSLLAIEQPNAQGDGATFDDVQVDNSGTIQIDPSELRVTLTISDGSTVTGGLLSIGPVGVLDVEGGSFSQEVLLDGVSVNNGDVINIGLSSTAIFTLDDGAKIEGGALTVSGGSALDVEYGSIGPGATLDNVGISGAGTILVDSEGNPETDLLLSGATAITGTALTIDSPGMVEIAPDVVGGNYVSPTFTNLSLDNAGTVQLDPNTTLLIGGNVALTGGGTVELMTATEQFAAAIAGAGSGVLDNFNDTIKANGDGASIGIDDQSLTFINESGGTVDADGNDSSNDNGDVSIALDTGNTVTNDGILEAANGGTIFVYDPLTGSGTDVIENGGAFVLAAANGQTVAYEGSGGTLTTNGAIDGGSATGISATSTSGAAMTITTNTSSTVTSTGADAIDATDSGGAGDISITANGAVTGAMKGIYAIQNGSGNITVGGSSNIIGQSGYGIEAEQTTTGLGYVSIDGTGSVTGTGSTFDGILAEILNSADVANVTVDQTGNVAGGELGINALTDGTGNVSVATGSNTNVTGTTLYGIQTRSYGTGSILVTTAPDDTISSASAGIVAVNRALTISQSAGSTVTVNAYGTINSGTTLTDSGSRPAAILAGYDGETTGSGTANANVFGNVTVYDYANITAAAGDGIRAANYGYGNVTVIDGTLNNVTSGQGTTIDATAQYGIDAFTYFTGDVSVSTSAGDSITSGGTGILAYNEATAISVLADSTITVNANGTINSGPTLDTGGQTPGGIKVGYSGGTTTAANLNVTGDVIINNNANITAAAGWGINAFNYGNGDVTVSDSALTTVSGPTGIAGYQQSGGTGDVDITLAAGASAGTGAVVTGTASYGIQAYSTGTGNVSVTTGANDIVNSRSSGILATNGATTIPETGGAITSTITVTAYGAINSGSTLEGGSFSPAGISVAYKGASSTNTPNLSVFGDITIDDYANITASAGYGIKAFDYGQGNITIQEFAGTINPASGDSLQDGILAEQESGGIGNIAITVDLVATVTGNTGVFALLTGAGTVAITNYGTITGVTGTAIGLSLPTGDTVTIENYGTMDGTINVITGASVYNDAGATWNASSIVNNGNIVDGGILDVTGAITGTGIVTIAAGGMLELGGADAGTIAFAGTAGTLLLEQPSSFSGKISGPSPTVLLDASDIIDLKGFDAADTTATPGSYVSGTTTLTVHDSSDDATISLVLVGNYSTSTWTVTNDNNGGADLADPAAPAATIATGGNLDINTPSNEAVTFTGGTGSLVLNDPEGFTGKIIGFTGTAPDAAHSDTIDLVGINYGSSQFAELYNSVTGLLTVTDGTNSASITFDDFNATLDFASDGNGGTLITDPPATGSSGTTVSASLDCGMKFDTDKIDSNSDQSMNQPDGAASLDGPKDPLVSLHNDTFVFHPNLGAEIGANVGPHVNHENANHADTQLIQQLEALVTPDPHHAAFIDILHNDNFNLLSRVSPAEWHEQLANAVHLH